MAQGGEWWPWSRRSGRRSHRYPGDPAPPPQAHYLPYDEGQTAEGHHYNRLRHAPYDPYAVGPAPSHDRNAADIFPAYQAPPYHRPAEAYDRPLPYVHPSAAAAAAPYQPAVVPWRSHHHQPAEARAAPRVPLAAPAAPARPVPAASGAPLQAVKAPLMPPAAAAPVKPHVAAPSGGAKSKPERKAKRRRTREHSMVSPADTPRRSRRSVSGYESDARTSAGASRAESRYTTGIATSTAATTGRGTTRSGTSSSSSSSSSETARVIRMMKTHNLPRPPPDNWQPAVKLTVAVLLSGTTFALVMVFAYILETTVLLPWETVDPNPASNPSNHGNESLIVASENTTTDEAVNASAVARFQPMRFQDQYYEESLPEEPSEMSADISLETSYSIP